MRKIIALLIGIVLVYSCSTSSDGAIDAVPVPPTNLTGNVISTTQINLTWTDNSTNETGFKIERKTATGNYAVVGTTATDITTFSDTGLTPNTAYIFRVYSNNAVGNSLTYSNELTLTTASSIVTDYDGNSYALVTICNQIWTNTNLNVSHYRNGDVIPQVTDASQLIKLTTGAWCYYANTTSNGTTYGKLYNWYAVHDIRGLAPTGYHIPTDEEWTTLTTCLGGEGEAGGQMKATTWPSPNTAATNSSGFTGLPGGYAGNGVFIYISYLGVWWSSTESNTTSSWYRSLHYDKGNFVRYSAHKSYGSSVRCLKD